MFQIKRNWFFSMTILHFIDSFFFNLLFIMYKINCVGFVGRYFILQHPVHATYLQMCDSVISVGIQTLILISMCKEKIKWKIKKYCWVEFKREQKCCFIKQLYRQYLKQTFIRKNSSNFKKIKKVILRESIYNSNKDIIYENWR